MIHTRELEVLNILSGSERGMTLTEIASAGDKLSQSTIMAVLRKLLDEGYVCPSGMTRCGNVYGRVYSITDAAKKAVLEQYVNNYRSISNIVTVDEVVEALR